MMDNDLKDDLVDELIDEDPLPEEPLQGDSWLHRNFKVVAVLLSILMSPVCGYFGSGRVEKLRQKFEQRDREKKREMQLRIERQKMRTTLVKEVVSIAKNADLNNVAHAYRIGLIADIVMANPDVFKLNMKDAKENLDVIVKKMKVVHNIRKQLTATEKSEAKLQVKVKEYDKQNDDLEKKLKSAKKKYDAVKWKNYAERVKWQKKVSDAEKALQRSRLRRREYYNRMLRERTRMRRYTRYLWYTRRRLQASVNEAKKAKEKSDKEIVKLNNVLASLGKKSSAAYKEVKQLKKLVKDLTKARDDAEATVQDLNDERKKLTKANKGLVDDVRELTKKLTECTAEKKKKGMAP